MVGQVGQVITGVIGGLFDAGYLVKVKVGDSETHLRGLVFLPSRFIPITAANDVAPQAKKNRRADIPIPVSYPPTQLPSFVTSPEQSDKQLVELKKVAPTAQDEGLQSGFQPTVPTAKESQSAPQMLPLTEYLQSSRTFLGGKVVRHQVLGSGCDNQSASAMVQMGHNKVAGQHDLMLEFEASLRKGLNLSVKENEQSKSVSLPAPPADILPGSETAKMELEIQQQPSSDDLKLNQPVHYGVKSPSSFMEKKASPENVAPPEPAMKIISGDDKSHLNGSSIAIPSTPKLAAEGSPLQRVTKPQSDGSSGGTNIMKAGPDTSATVILPATLFGREAILPESKTASDELVLRRMTTPQICSSPGVANNVDSNIKDVIPPAES
ncbi:hypothetical protein POTOM_039112 [Populus tomentosa]|uniref:Uncharacterized protein n=1 Tax=Populus tomentosa TaxID=118781 RepID=A0A8X7Z2P4_POPTO|nr:hypothetical protein POTOM_039112 [Populus tomentosa]